MPGRLAAGFRSTSLLLLLLVATGPLDAQRLSPEQDLARLRWTPALEAAGSVRAHGGLLGDGSRDHRYAGMYSGMALSGLFLIASLSICSDPDTSCDSGRAITAFPVALVFLGGVGALIGSAFPKHHPPP